jgi:hypothetical protein
LRLGDDDEDSDILVGDIIISFSGVDASLGIVAKHTA